MRILHVGKFFPPHPGGIERCMADLCGALHARGVSVAALAHNEPGEKSIQRHDASGFEVTLAACRGHVLYAPVSPSFPLLLKRSLAQFRPDLLHLHLPNTSAFFALLSPAARRLPWVVHWHADIPLDTRQRMLRVAYGIYRPWEKRMLRQSAAIIATSELYLASSHALIPWRSKTHVIPLGIGNFPSPSTSSGERTEVSGQRENHALPYAHALPRHPTLSPIASDGRKGEGAALGDSPSALGPQPSALNPRLRVLAVGRLSYFKGIDVLLRAVAEVADARLMLVGDGECRAALERLANDLGIAGRVHFAGRIDMNQRGAATLQAAYASADVFCLPSTDRAESFGLVLLEAMRARLPVIASAIPGSGVGYVVRDGETGLLVVPGDAGALAQALRRLSGDAVLRMRLGSAGAQRWSDEFTLDRAADRVLQLYRRVLAAPAAGATAAPAD
ncbi:MAG TPA: glycosyltransferase [Rudaea sp.]|jgi:glycosyltransferase involved in cell wall biosynthesis